MYLKSMTGYGKYVVNHDLCDIKVEMKSVNNRYFDIHIRMPRLLNPVEIQIKNLLKEKLVRGKADVFIEVNLKKVQYVPRLNKELAETYVDILNDLKETVGVQGDLKLEHVLRFNDVISSEEDESVSDELCGLVLDAVHECAVRIDEMRRDEGVNLEKDLKQRLDTLAERTKTIDENRGEVYEYWLNRFNRKMQEFGVAGEYEDRVIQEASILSEKADISEEVTRLYSHIEQFRSVMGDNAAGKKLDFLCQELQREYNTIGSKSGNVSVINLVVDCKSEVDKIREQVQNIV